MSDFLSELLGQHLNELSEFKDPFRKDYIVSVTFACNKFGNGWQCSGRIHYVNGLTGGYQDFNSPSLPALLKQMAKFVEEMK